MESFQPPFYRESDPRPLPIFLMLHACVTWEQDKRREDRNKGEKESREILNNWKRIVILKSICNF